MLYLQALVLEKNKGLLRKQEKVLILLWMDKKPLLG